MLQAANCYEQLTLQQPEEEDYKVYYAQSLYAASLYQEAMKVTVTVEGPDHQAAMLKLQAAIKWVQQKNVNIKEVS
jgi:tetratricopeptide repeat protein 30